MVIRVEDIKEKGLFLEFSEKPETFPALLEMSETGALALLAPLSVRLRAIRVQDLVEVEGSIETRLRVTCSRCLKECETPLSIPFAVTFHRGPVEIDEESDVAEEVELSAEEMGLIPFQGDEIELREVMQEQVVMGLPLRPLCDEACRGLCPECGKDLNEGNCGCAPAVFAGKLAKLKDFKVERKEPEKK